jgi:hypothetical protein
VAGCPRPRCRWCCRGGADLRAGSLDRSYKCGGVVGVCAGGGGDVTSASAVPPRRCVGPRRPRSGSTPPPSRARRRSRPAPRRPWCWRCVRRVDEPRLRLGLGGQELDGSRRTPTSRRRRQQHRCWNSSAT